MDNKKVPLWQKITGAALGLCVLITAAFFYVKKDLSKPLAQSTIKPVLADELKKMITNASDSLYRLEFSFFDINIDSGKGLIKNLKLIADTAVYKKLLAARKAPNSLLSLSVDSAVLTQFSFDKTPTGKKLVVKDIIIQNPKATLTSKLQTYNDSVPEKDEELLMKTMKNLMQFASIQHVYMQNMSFTMVNNNGSVPRKTAIKNLNVSINDINTFTTKQQDSSHKEYTTFTIGSNRMATPDSLYFLTAEGITFQPGLQLLAIKKATLLPRLNKQSFYKTVNFAKDRFHFIYNDISYKGIDINKVLSKQQLHVRQANIGSSWGEIYTDYNYKKHNPPLRTNSFPHLLLQQLAFDITIDTMDMHNGAMEYAIKADKSDEVATFKTDNMETRIVNITNNAAAKKANHYTTANLKGRIMNGAFVTSNLRFNLSSKDGAFSLSNSLASMPGTLMNPVTKPLALIEIKSLDIIKMNTTINGNIYSAKGNIDFYYRNMKMNFLKKENSGDEYKKKGLLSFVSNVFTPDDNPKKNGKFKKGPIDIKRDPHTSFFGFLWQCMLEGMTVHMLGLKKV